MARTESNAIPLGTVAPTFQLPDVVSGETRSRDEVFGQKGTLVMFICNHCPFVKHIQEEIGNMWKDYQPSGVAFVAISSNDVENYPDDSPDNLKKQAGENGFSFPYLYDETQEVARSYDAACTPDFFLFDPDKKLVYHGQLDSSRPGNEIPVTGRDLRAALDSLQSGNEISKEQIPSLGCNIKWKS
jgi:peroxiredoxin